MKRPSPEVVVPRQMQTFLIFIKPIHAPLRTSQPARENSN
jgi:hypothetical protein